MQDKVKTFNSGLNCHKKQMPEYARVLVTSSELGELSKELLKATKYGTMPFEMSESFKMEYGDVLYCLLSLANELNIDANECLDMSLNKFKQRVAKNNNLGSGK